MMMMVMMMMMNCTIYVAPYYEKKHLERALQTFSTNFFINIYHSMIIIYTCDFKAEATILFNDIRTVDLAHSISFCHF